MAAIRRRYLVLLALRWFPVGLTMPVTVLLMQSRGLTLAQIGLVAAAQGVVVMVLELPTGGLADALGRRPVLLVAAGVNLASLAILTVADSVAWFAAVFVLQGVFRALDSGPLDAWYVDAVLHADRAARYESGLSRGGAVLGLAIAGGALAAGGLVALDPVPAVGALVLPVAVAVATQVVALLATLALLTEPRRARGLRALRAAVVQVPTVMRGAARLASRSRVLLALVSVELLWGFGMVTFETLLPPRLAEAVGSADGAAALLGPVGAAGWLVSAAGAAAVPLLTARLGAPLTGALLRVLHGATVVGLGLAAGPVGVVAALLVCYAVHGASNPVHLGLLHRQVESAHRSTVLSLNSLMGQSAAAAGLVVLTAVADAVDLRAAFIAGALALAAAAPLYLPAWRAERAAGCPQPVDNR
ncbi:MAG TPA: MFS transporter [Pilimelia sp.]|nr:MFS transporter [Pilimelia sp.]